MSRIKVAVVDDHRIIRDGIVSLFRNDTDIEIVNDFESGVDLLEAMQKEQYDLVLLDMHMPVMDGIATAEEVLKKYPAARILIHTMSEIIEEIEQVVKLGAHGYILKNAGLQELSVAIKVVANGGSYYSTTVINSFIKSCVAEKDNPLKVLTKDEIAILALLNQENLTLPAIAAQVNITEEELNTTIDHIKKALGIKNDIGLGKFCALHYHQLTCKK